MYAIIETGGKQYRVKEGTIIEVELLPLENGASFEAEKVLFFKDNDEKVKIGTPLLDEIKVTGKVIEHFKGDKVIVIKRKRRKGYRVKKGHRQNHTRIKIEKIAG